MSNASFLFVLGAADPELQAIETLLKECGIRYAYAVDEKGKRVFPGNAYKAKGYAFPEDPNGSHALGLDDCPATHRVECGWDGWERSDIVVIDHHRPGDPGYGAEPAKFLQASSIGQFAQWIADNSYDRGPVQPLLPGPNAQPPEGAIPVQNGSLWICKDGQIFVTVSCDGGEGFYIKDGAFVAAADHCLGAAYRGECPGVDRDALVDWRALSRATFQKRPVGEVLQDVSNARKILQKAVSDIYLEVVRTDGEQLALQAAKEAIIDLRGLKIPELPEASAREGVCFISDGLPGPDGKIKVVCQSGTPDQIDKFINGWAPEHGLVDVYGDPQRGFAGGYLDQTRQNA